MRGNVFKHLLRLMSSRELLLFLAGAWIFYYVTYTIWSKEAFGSFMQALEEGIFFKALFVLFIVCMSFNLLRGGAERLRRGKALFALWVLLPAGVLVFLVGFFLSSSYRQHGRAFVGLGSEVRPPWQGRTYHVSDIKSPLKKELLDIEAGSGIFSYEPSIVLDTGTEKVEVGVFPPKKIGDTYYHIMDFGLAPGVRLSQEARLVREVYIIQRILPPPAQDSFEIKPFPYKFTIWMTPERTLRKGKTKAKLYNLDSPSYMVTVLKGEEVVFEGDSREGVRFDGLRLSFEKPAYWVWLEASRSPGMPLLVAGISMMAVGLPLMFVYMILKIRSSRRSVAMERDAS